MSFILTHVMFEMLINYLSGDVEEAIEYANIHI